MSPGKPKGRAWLPYLWSLLVGVAVVTAVLWRLAGQGLQSYGSDGAQFIEHTARLRLLKMWQQLGDGSAWRFLFDADAAQSQLPLAFGGMPKLGGSAGLAGTFNAAIAGMLGRSGDDPGERTADAVESMDEKLTDIRDELKDRPPLAFEA